ncbi:T-complex protein 1 subunit beta [Galdieria sulphuraria]|nr:T-complex protein 1 subunit beta [Galdieria sulphuraria]
MQVPRYQGPAPHVLKRDTSEEKGEEARMSSFIGALALCDLVKTTLGPKGMDKILQSASGDIIVTNDGATILKSVSIDNAAAKILVDISKTQDDEIGDGTTSVCCLAGELLREAEKLLDAKIHPQLVVSGYRIAANAAQKALQEAAMDHGANFEQLKQDLFYIAKTTLSSKLLAQSRDHFAKMAVEAVLRLKGSTNLDHIQFIKKTGGNLSDSYLDEGFILEKTLGVGQPKRVENAKILIANTPMDTDKIKVYGARCQKILNHGINCFVNRQLIYNRPEQFFTDHGIMAIEHADFDGVERLALVTGGEVVSTFDHPELVKLGHCGLIEESMIGEDRVIRFSNCAAKEACTIVLRGANKQILDEAERSLHDALCVLSQTVNHSKVVYGGGSAEMLMAKAVDEVAKTIPGKQSLAVEGFARALRAIPTIVADNAGFDATELISEMRAAHQKGEKEAGIDIQNGILGNMAKLHVLESFKLKSYMVSSATEAAEMIIRVDDIIKAAPRRREE